LQERIRELEALLEKERKEYSSALVAAQAEM
jgi:hypothetical protein